MEIFKPPTTIMGGATGGGDMGYNVPSLAWYRGTTQSGLGSTQALERKFYSLHSLRLMCPQNVTNGVKTKNFLLAPVASLHSENGGAAPDHDSVRNLEWYWKLWICPLLRWLIICWIVFSISVQNLQCLASPNPNFGFSRYKRLWQKSVWVIHHSFGEENAFPNHATDLEIGAMIVARILGFFFFKIGL